MYVHTISARSLSLNYAAGCLAIRSVGRLLNASENRVQLERLPSVGVVGDKAQLASNRQVPLGQTAIVEPVKPLHSAANLGFAPK
jgi:hypothetical protein